MRSGVCAGWSLASRWLVSGWVFLWAVHSIAYGELGSYVGESINRNSLRAVLTAGANFRNVALAGVARTV